MRFLLRTTFLLLICLFLFLGQAWAQEDAATIVKKAFNYMRGRASVSTVTMTIHRPDWQRVVTIKSWTLGESDSIFTIIAPPKDRGNGTLKKGHEMWMYNPKVNRVIKLPPSMMSQAWMGSDFSNNDLSKTDSIIKDYRHTLEGRDTVQGQKVYRIKCMPKPQAPVVWGMVTLKIRQDNVTLEQVFYDEDLKPVKTLTFMDIKKMGGRLFPAKWRMQKAEAKDEYTLLQYQSLEFKESLPPSLFTLSSLRRPRH